MEIVVFGAGSLGSLVGGLLARAHDVTLVGREPHVSAIRESGLRVGGDVSFVVHPDARTDVPESAVLALVTVKSFDTPGAAAALADRDLDAVLSLQNGLGNEERLAAELDTTVLAGTCTYGAHRNAPGEVTATGPGEVALGPPDGGASPIAERVGAAFQAADIGTTVAADMPRRRWEKVAINAGINPTTALLGVRNGALRDGPARQVATAAASETVQVAREHGIAIDERETLAALEEVIAATAANTSSMAADAGANRPTEIDAINGAVVDRADGTVRVPVNRTLANLVRALDPDERR